MKAKKIVAVVGPDTQFLAKRDAKVGDIIEFKKHMNQEFPDEIQAYLNGEQIGSIAKSDSTAKGAVRLSEIESLVEDNFWGTVEKIFEGGRSITLHISIDFGEEIEENSYDGGNVMNKTKRVKVLLEGTKGVTPKKYSHELIRRIREGNQIACTFEDSDEGMFAIAEDSAGKGRFGIVSPRETSSTIPDVQLRQLLRDKEEAGVGEYEAFVTGKDASGIDFICEIEFTSDSALEKAMAENEANGVLSNAEIQRRIDYIPKGLAEKNTAEIIAGIKHQEMSERIPDKPFGFINNGKILEKTIALLNAGKNLLFIGPKGSGKNTLADDMAMLRYQPLFEMQFSASTDGETILGSKTIEAKETAPDKEKVNKLVGMLFEVLAGKKSSFIESSPAEQASEVESINSFSDIDFTPLINAIKGGETVVKFKPSPLVQAMEVGGICVLDEINTTHASVTALLHPILDKRRRIEVPFYGTVVAHPDFRVIGTMNRDYQGTMELNEALKSRFFPLVFSESRDIKAVIRKNCDNVSVKMLDACQSLFNNIISMVDSGEWSSEIINIRGFIDACDLNSWGIPIKDCLMGIADNTEDEDIAKSIRQYIKNMRV